MDYHHPECWQEHHACAVQLIEMLRDRKASDYEGAVSLQRRAMPPITDRAAQPVEQTMLDLGNVA